MTPSNTPEGSGTSNTETQSGDLKKREEQIAKELKLPLKETSDIIKIYKPLPKDSD